MKPLNDHIKNKNIGLYKQKLNVNEIKSYKSATYINPEKNIDVARLKNTKMPLIKPIFSKERINRHNMVNKLERI